MVFPRSEALNSIQLSPEAIGMVSQSWTNPAEKNIVDGIKNMGIYHDGVYIYIYYYYIICIDVNMYN